MFYNRKKLMYGIFSANAGYEVMMSHPKVLLRFQIYIYIYFDTKSNADLKAMSPKKTSKNRVFS